MNRDAAASPSSAATASRSPARTAPTRNASNQDMLTAALDGLVDRFGLEGERLGEVVAGAVLKHSRDFNLTRESVLGCRLAPETPAYDVQQACGTGLEAAILVANKIALGQIDVGHRRRRRHHVRRADRRQRGPAPDPARRSTARKSQRRPARSADAAAARQQLVPDDPAQRRAAHRPVDGRARGAISGRVGRSRARRRTSWPSRSHQQPGRRLRARLLRRPGHALPGARARPEPARGLDRREAGEAEAGLRRRRAAR